MTRSGRTARALALAALLGAAACDDGPGTWTAAVEGPGPVGAALVEVRGDGVRGFEGAGDSRVFADPSPSRGGGWRVVVVSPSGSAAFRIRVADGEGPRPAVTLLSAADVADRSVTALGGYEVRVAR